MKHKLLLGLAVAALGLGTMAPAFAQEGDAPAAQERDGKRGGMFAKVDKDGDGFISLDEHLSKAKEHFAKMDKDGDGKLGKDEIRSGMKKMHEKRGEKRKIDRAAE